MLFDCGRTAQLPCCARVVVCCYRTGWVVLVLGHWLADVFCGCFWPRASALASSAWRCCSRLVLLCSWMQCLARGTVVLLCMSSGMLPSYRLGCASAWLAYVFCGCLWPRASALASSAWRCWSRLVLLCSWMQCLARGTVVMLCMSSGMLPSYRLGCASAWLADVFCCCFWPRASALASSAWRCWSRLVLLCSWIAVLGARHSCHVVHE